MAELQGFQEPDPHYATKSIHAGCDPAVWTFRDVATPISLSTIFKQRACPASSAKQDKSFMYGRVGNPIREVLESRLAALEKAKYVLCFASGVGAVGAVIHLLCAGDHWICHDDLYPGVVVELQEMALRMGIQSTFLDARDPNKVKHALKDNTKMIWVEPITNPMLRLVDIQALAEVARSKQGCMLAVDNTFFTSYFMPPLELGAHLAVYSATKYVNGHNDVTMGYVALNDPIIYEQLYNIQQGAGCVPSPFDCYLTLRSLKTLSLRMRRHMTSSLQVAQFLASHPLVERVIHPGLEDYEYKELLRRQTKGYSGMLSFYVAGDRETARLFTGHLKIVTHADSLGGAESVVKIPAVMGTSFTEEEAAQRGITPNLVRMSVGLEEPDDLIADLRMALEKAGEGVPVPSPDEDPFTLIGPHHHGCVPCKVTRDDTPRHRFTYHNGWADLWN